MSNLGLTPKILVAKELLERALRLYYEGDSYFASLHLAGGAEQILGTYVTRAGAENAFKSLQMAAVCFSALDDGGPCKSGEIKALMVHARNRIKHLDEEDDDEINFDPREEAKNLLRRAVSNYHHLMNYYPLGETPLLRRFNEDRS
ncbi:hypothetical protein CR105_06315 [Massilia eurypsychrophila]|uniref:HEPN domain-containing protein n=1 Tax=Massilia eurypsychrophila TaxID=1485217 RepID=A0A2G8TJ96_9BURK|nr:hypothetical protein [Massilia eurypsychrophila]PIL45688.1 hypothetical protein CR105_06315 [Massilia eurypsychrophila]